MVKWLKIVLVLCKATEIVEPAVASDRNGDGMEQTSSELAFSIYFFSMTRETNMSFQYKWICFDYKV